MSERGNSLLRLADDGVGPLLLGAVAPFRKRRTLPTAPKRIGVMCFGALGDLLLLSAIQSDLSRAFPSAEIIFIGSSTNRSIVPLLPIDHFVDLPVTRPDIATRRLREMSFDIILDSSQWARLPALLCAGSGAFCIGFRTPGQRRHFAYDALVDHRNDRHEIENFRALAQVIAPTTSDTRPTLVVTDENRAAVQSFNLGRYVVFHPWPSGARAELKEWPTKHWVALSDYVASRGYAIALTGAPVDKEKSAALAAAIGSRATVHDTAGKLRLPETAALLESAALTLSVNTGIMHMAACFQAPVVGLSGPTNPLRWGPLSPRSANPKPATDACWYLNLGFEYPDAPVDCMDALSPDVVAQSVDGLL